MDPSLYQRVVRAMALSSRFTASVATGVLVGLGVDRLVGSGPAALLIFALAGLAVGTWHLLRDVRNSFDDSSPPRDPGTSDSPPGRG